jgi:hypothetical protein
MLFSGVKKVLAKLLNSTLKFKFGGKLAELISWSHDSCVGCYWLILGQDWNGGPGVSANWIAVFGLGCLQTKSKHLAADIHVL